MRYPCLRWAVESRERLFKRSEVALSGAELCGDWALEWAPARAPSRFPLAAAEIRRFTRPPIDGAMAGILSLTMDDRAWYSSVGAG